MKYVYQRLLSRLRRRIANMINRATITGVDTSNGVTLLQFASKAGQPDDGVAYYELYGFTSTPLVGAKVLVLCLGGYRIAVCATDSRYRIKNLPNGDVAVYDFRGQTITLSADGVTIDTSLALTVNAGDSTFNGNIKATGNIAADGDLSDATGTVQAMRDIYNVHTQQVSGTTAAAPTVPMA